MQIDGDARSLVEFLNCSHVGVDMSEWVDVMTRSCNRMVLLAMMFHNGAFFLL